MRKREGSTRIILTIPLSAKAYVDDAALAEGLSTSAYIRRLIMRDRGDNAAELAMQAAMKKRDRQWERAIMKKQDQGFERAMAKKDRKAERTMKRGRR